jgi:oligopeptide transport system ATP-binding protein
MTVQTAQHPLVRVTDLKVHFPIKRGLFVKRQVGAVRAVDGVSLDIQRGTTLGLVGESGCGKSTTGQAILQLIRPTSGEVLFEGRDMTQLKGDALRRERRKFQMVYQDPFSSLNERMTAKELIMEPLLVHRLFNTVAEREERVYDLMEAVGLDPAASNRYPGQFSGGQRQRIGIARALAVDPLFIVCDEPIAALDVSIQAQVVNLFIDLRERLGLTYLFIAHDLAMVQHISDEIAVMYLGKIVEYGRCDAVTEGAMHPYTQALLNAVPTPNPDEELAPLEELAQGEVPSAANPPKGCNFCTRCQHVMDVCYEVEPELKSYAQGQWVACHLYE